MLINTMRTAAGEVILEIRGEIDAANADRLRRALVGAGRQRPTRVVVDLLYVTFIDSIGIVPAPRLRAGPLLDRRRYGEQEVADWGNRVTKPWPC